MSYIINNTSAFVNIKLTEKGRMRLAQGKLSFNYWKLGDSEINYDIVSNLDDETNNPIDYRSSRILQPVDSQPDLKYIVKSSTSDELGLNDLKESDINTIKAVVNNKAKDRGFFKSSNKNYVTDTYIKGQGSIPTSDINGNNYLVVGNGDWGPGDLVMLKISNDTIGNIPVDINYKAIPNLWYKITAFDTTNTFNDTIVLDRKLPNIQSTTAESHFIVYGGGEVHEVFGFDETTPYWDTNTLSFNNNCDVSCSDVPVWNMNNVWCENLAGMTGSSINNSVSTPNESYESFGSTDYLGQKYPYLNYKCSDEEGVNDVDECGDSGQSVVDSVKKSISILHYTNNTISNYYGEYLYIDGDNNKHVEVRLPNIMYHRREYITEGGWDMGMTFIASGNTQLIENSQIEYIDLMEDSTMINGEPKIVGKVFPKLKTIVFDDDEIVAAMSYKSNRNWTLPHLSANLVSSDNGTNQGVLPSNKTMYLTYSFENDSGVGLNSTLPCQYYTKIYNSTRTSKDVQFKINDLGELPYMKKVEKPGYDGIGFSAKQFKLLYQIVDNGDRPKSDNWSVYDYTSTNLTTVSGETIDPLKLESQNPTTNQFLIDEDVVTNSSEFSIIDTLNMATNNAPDMLQFGDERFFYGNVETFIGASIFKTIFNLKISADNFNVTTNPTRSNSVGNSTDIMVSEIGIYDTSGTLVMIGKLSKPIKLTSGNTIMLELSIDF